MNMSSISKIIEKIKQVIASVYKAFYHGVMRRKEPYTYQLSRMLIFHGIFFWLVYLTLVVWLSYVLFNSIIIYKVLAVIGIFLASWLIDHLIDHIREHPDWYDSEDKC